MVEPASAPSEPKWRSSLFNDLHGEVQKPLRTAGGRRAVEVAPPCAESASEFAQGTDPSGRNPPRVPNLTEAPDGLDVHELAQSIYAQLASVARVLHTTKGEPRIRGDHLVDEDQP